ncbi:ergosterol biosynthesis ERG4/ERG24 [Ochromonadaceae sp. CCMP2298]|nr:ergosterol biosynthesis ERG4/ERG24 [Ochromonadaceae sp. CCMP2298]|mmetsp:Transcript_21795/g.48494  ORF Transcript_21795/g.48494 Transcript_21795/m.48494 type:complete len:445 (+) Transcript_21795:69-1403(+)|eukprot:CAMPEP_0173203406 /NCGR_PEP_ID=MMETSP1141-20130122/19500_1 /TAXON_ID=483371 /ORGANISM="non described non described, Strain CCMP2298" /LENGTH=444 /DNA_ID=CAMNT_0014128857 /DNA_START=20 /DNA_END=1354 /DNA_ORIENTATION=+
MADDDDKKSWGSGGLFANRELGSLALIFFTQVFCVPFFLICKDFNGSFSAFGAALVARGAVPFMMEVWPTPFDPYVWKMLLSFMAFELFLMRAVPGKVFKATPTASGHIPVYNANGVQCYLITLVALFAIAHYGLWNPADVYDYMPKILSSLNVFALGFCTMLTLKGLTFPSTKDSGTNGNLIVDFFWGTELYPRILGFDVKQFTNCRFGLMFWQVGIICYAFKQYQLLGGFISSSMMVSIVLQTVYLFKFYYWETGYFCSMDIQHDRAGYYICWGCLVYVPSMYTVHTYFMTEQPSFLSLPATLFCLALGIFFIWANYDCDRQRQDFRQYNGKNKVWGKLPDYIEAKYMTEDGERRTSLLLCSGWWSLARHFHYIPEVAASFMWCVPGLFTLSHPMPYFYPVYLSILLVDRAWRDDARCADKYGMYWHAYCKKVPCKIIPGVI